MNTRQSGTATEAGGYRLLGQWLVGGQQAVSNTGLFLAAVAPSGWDHNPLIAFF